MRPILLMLGIGLFGWQRLLAQPAEVKDEARQNQVAVILAQDGKAQNPLLDFYRAVYQSLDKDGKWSPAPIQETRRVLASFGKEVNRFALPSIELKSFRQSIPKAAATKKGAEMRRNDELQFLLDTTANTAAIVIDCQEKANGMLKACGLYYYDRGSGKLKASATKNFATGVMDANAWAKPLLDMLHSGLMAARNSRDQAIVEELMSRPDDDDDNLWRGALTVAARGDTVDLKDAGSAALAGYEVGAGANSKGMTLLLQYLQETRRGSGLLSRIDRESMGLHVLFEAKAMESLLWHLQLGVDQEATEVKGADSSDFVDFKGLVLGYRVGLGVAFGDSLSFSFGPTGRYFFENSRTGEGQLEDTGLSNKFLSGAYARLMILF